MKLPHDDSAEAAVLAGVLVADTLPEVSMKLSEADFYRSQHRTVYSACLALAAEGQPIDVLAATQALKGTIEPMVVRDLADGFTTPGASIHQASVVAALGVRRRLANAGSRITELVDTERDTPDVLAEAEQLVLDADTDIARGSSVDWNVALGNAVERLEYMANQDTPIIGVPTGYGDIDHRLSGLHPGSYYLVGARPSVGKTSFVTGIMLHAAQVGTKVAMFSLEMTADEIAMRAACSVAGVSSMKFRRNLLQDADWSNLVAAQEKLSDLPITIYDEGVETPHAVAARCRRERDLGLVIIDYVGLMRWPKDAGTRNDELTEISASLKRMAKRLRVPVLVCAQLNRKLEERKDRKPVLSDLRDSGSLEQDADVVMLLHRADETPHRVEVITAKHRNGPTGDDILLWNADTTTFSTPWMRGAVDASRSPSSG